MTIQTRPAVLSPFLGVSAASERAYFDVVLRAAREHYETVEVPCAGTATIARDALEAGWPAEAVTLSDVGLVPCLTGTTITGGDTRDLNVLVDGEPIGAEDTFDHAARVMHHLVVLRSMRRRGRPQRVHPRTAEAVRREGEARIESTADLLRKWHEKCSPMSFRAEGVFEHIGRVKDGPALIVANPPWGTRPRTTRTRLTPGPHHLGRARVRALARACRGAGHDGGDRRRPRPAGGIPPHRGRHSARGPVRPRWQPQGRADAR